MQKRVINLTMAGVTGVMLACGVAAGVTANAESTDSGIEQSAEESRGALSDAVESDGKPGKKIDKKIDKKIEKKVVKKKSKALLTGRTTASYFFDDGSGINGDTGAPASGISMRKGLFASPSWPMRTKVKVSYKGRSVTGFIGDRGPGTPSHNGVMLDLDTYTFRYLYDGKKPASKYNAGVSAGHLKGLKYEVLKWGKGAGKKGKPRPFGS